MDESRRCFARGLAAALGVCASTGALGALSATPRQSAGPFYPSERPLDDDSDLTRVTGQPARASGEISDLDGRVLDVNGRAVAGARVEIWQCDANGRYRHPGDPGRADIDPGFQGFGHAIADTGGRFHFRTIRPVAYPGRTPHIHVAVIAGGEHPFVTQLYVAGDARNERDFLYRRIAVERRDRVTVDFAASNVPGVDYSASWDIVLGGV